MCAGAEREPPSDDLDADMTSPRPRWVRAALLLALLSSALGQACASSSRLRTRHPHTAGLHRRSVRADARAADSDSSAQRHSQVYARQGERLELECAVNINFSTSIWLKDGQIVSTVLRGGESRPAGHRLLVGAGGDLLIDGARPEDDGRWQCEAEDAFGFVVQGRPVQLTILEPPKKVYLMIDNRILDPGNPFIPVKENTDLMISCVVDEGNPRPSLSWDLTLGSRALLEIPEVPLEVMNYTEIVREQKVGARTDARLARVLRAHHNATLTCFVKHMALEQALNVSVLLNVEYTPSFAISREPGFGIPIREGMPVWLRCEVDANPTAAPEWRRGESAPPVAQDAHGYLNFTAIRKEHAGWYKCVARHRLGRFSSIGYFLNVRHGEVTQEPEFDVSELSSTGRQVEVSLGGAVQLACPPGTYGCWAKTASNGNGRLEPLGASQELRLDDVVYQEGGEYRCVAPRTDAAQRLNQARSALSVHLVVTGRPTVLPTNKSITAVYGQPLTLTMEFCANPPYDRIIWIANNNRVYKPGDADKRVIAYGVTNATEPNCHQAVLFLTKVTTSDTGEYSFIVRSPNGLAEGSFHVNLTYASGYNVPEEEEDYPKTNCAVGVTAVLQINVIVLTLTKIVTD